MPLHLYLYCMNRSPCLAVARSPKLPNLLGSISTKLFVDFFIDEIRIRSNTGRAGPALGMGVAEKYGKMLSRQAVTVWDAAHLMKVSPINLSFIFLNRYYAIFSKRNPVPKMRYFWDEFLIELSNDLVLQQLLNYSDSDRAEICSIIGEIAEAKQSPVLIKFMTDHAKGYSIKFPEHMRERSKLFETVLIMNHQIKHSTLGISHFLKKHAIEIIKAHVWGLYKHGNPVQLHLGNFIGDNAMFRLKNYSDWTGCVIRTCATGIRGDEY